MTEQDTFNRLRRVSFDEAFKTYTLAIGTNGITWKPIDDALRGVGWNWNEFEKEYSKFLKNADRNLILIQMTEEDTFNRLRRPTRDEMENIMLTYSREYERTGIAIELEKLLKENNWTYAEWEGSDD